MKLVRKYGICCAALLALIAFILLMATPALTQTHGNITLSVKGMTAIFGGDNGEPLGTSLTAWILLLIGLLCALFLAAVPYVKGIKLGKKILALLGLCTAVLLLVAGILAFCPVADINAKAGLNTGYGLGAGWVFGGILLILASLGAGLDPVLTLLDK